MMFCKIPNENHTLNTSEKYARSFTSVQNLANEILINIFKSVTCPRSFALTCKRFSAITRDDQARAEWIIYQYGRAHALFHAIRLGPTFINLSVAKAMIAKRAILSRYFIQRLLINFSKYDQQLIDLTLAHNIVRQMDTNRINQKEKVPWSSNLGILVFTYLMTEAQQLLETDNLCAKGNDMELFHFLSAGPRVINRARDILFSAVTRDDQGSDWIIYQYGRAHALFHGIRLGPTFISLSVAKAMIAKHAILSRYFIQRLLINFGKYDQQLIELKIAHNIVGQMDTNRIDQKVKVPWSSNLEIPVFTYLMTEAQQQLETDNLCAKGNDMELFHFLSAGPRVINRARDILRKNMNSVRNLILSMKFIPFPPSPQKMVNSGHVLVTSEEYPSKDGYENNGQLDVIARTISIDEELVHIWKEIGYCEDTNDLLIQGALLILFPPTPLTEWKKPNVKYINKRLIELINLGFQLNYNVIADVFHLSEHRLDDMGNALVELFLHVKHESPESFLYNYMVERLKQRSPETFLYNYIIERLKQEFPEAFLHNHMVKKLKQEPLETFLYNYMVEKLKQEFPETFIYNHIDEILEPGSIYEMVDQDFNVDASVIRIPNCFQNASQNQILSAKQATFSQHTTNSPTAWLEKAIFENHINYYDYNEFINLEKINEGRFGNVYKAEWSECGIAVALKSLKANIPKIVEELIVLRKVFFHPHIVEFYAVTRNPFGDYIMVLQFAKNGNLEQYLEDNFLKLQWDDKLRIAKEIALGLVFLHKHDIIHRDLHIKNILVHEDRMLIADFGLSIYDTENFIDYGIYGMPAFIDPQALKEFSYKFTKKSDIYGLGVIFWEISSGYRPFKTMTDIEIIFNVQQGNRETPIKNTPLRFVKLYELCWDETPEIRPEANTILEDLNLCTSDEVL